MRPTKRSLRDRGIKQSCRAAQRDAGELDSGVTELERVFGVFSDAWSGLSAAAAAARGEALRTETRAEVDAAETAARTPRRYADEVEAITHLAEEQIRVREISRRRMASIQVVEFGRAATIG